MVVVRPFHSAPIKDHSASLRSASRLLPDRLTLFEGFFTEEQHRLRVSLHLVQPRRGLVRPRPEDPPLAEPFSVNPLRRGGQHHPFLHEGQQGEQGLQLLAGRQRGGRLRQRDARKPAFEDGRSRRDERGGQVRYPDISALDLTSENLLS